MTAEIQYEDEETKERIVGKSFVRTDHRARTLDEFVTTGKYSELKPQRVQNEDVESRLLQITKSNLLSVKKLLLGIERDGDENFSEVFR